MAGRWSKQLVRWAAVVVACGAGVTWTGVARGVGEVAREGKQLMADALTTEAQTRGRNKVLSERLRTQEALVLLQMAERLTPDSPEVLRLLAMAALATGDTDLAQKSVKSLVRVDPDDLVAQVTFLDMLARGKPVEQQLKIYQTAQARPDLDAQVRSEMALRAGRLLLERGQAEEASKAFAKALELNDVNVGAWQEVVRIQAASGAGAPERLAGLVNLLMANPYQPDALRAGARILAASGQHEVATDWLLATVDQIKVSGATPPFDLGLEVTTEMACMGRRTDAEAWAKELATVENGPADAALLAYTIHAGGQLPGPADDPLLEVMRKRAAATIAANPKNDAALIEGIWSELYYAPTVAETVNDWMEKLRLAVGEKDPTYVRLFGWRLLRQGKMPEAQAQLEPLSAKDPWAMLGMLRIWEAAGNEVEAKKQVAALWEANPTGMLALHVQGEAKRVGLKLEETATAKMMRNVAKRLPDEYVAAGGKPRGVTLLLPTLPKKGYTLGEPIYLEVKATNQTERAMAVGPTGGVVTTMAVAGSLTGLDQRSLGVFAFDNSPRVYRIERHGSLVWKVRVDQGELRDWFYVFPMRLFNVGLTLITAPRTVAGTNGMPDQFVPGLGGQIVQAGQFDREGVNLGNPLQLLALARELPTSPAGRQMLVGEVFQSAAYAVSESPDPIPGTAPPGAATQAGISWADVRKQMIDSILWLLDKGDPVVKAWLLRQAPAKDLPGSVIEALDKLGQSNDPLVRMVHDRRVLLFGIGDATRRGAIAQHMRDLAGAEPDPLVKKWAELLADEAEEAVKLLPPTTAPATGP